MWAGKESGKELPRSSPEAKQVCGAGRMQGLGVDPIVSNQTARKCILWDCGHTDGPRLNTQL